MLLQLAESCCNAVTAAYCTGLLLLLLLKRLVQLLSCWCG
jgi:hypothetical protein